MSSATQLLWSAAGEPDPRKPVHPAEGRCYWCAHDVAPEACRVCDVCTSSFTDHDVARVPTSDWVCRGCAWTLTGRPPDTLRLWSLVYRTDREAAPSHELAPSLGPHVHLQNKADPSEFDCVLRSPPDGEWICAVADSGKIHVVPFAQVNRGSGPWVVRFERFDVRSSPAAYTAIADAMMDLYELGFSKDEIASGSPSPSKLYRYGAQTWRAHDEFLRRYRGGALFQLALFLMRKR